jgi:hypothetical protein
MRSDQSLALLSRENPVSEDELPGSEDAPGRALLERVMLDDVPDPRILPPPARGARRVLPRLAIAGAVAAAAGLGAFGGLPGDGVLPGDDPQPASAVERAAATIGAADDGILHIITRATVTGPDGRVLRSERTEAWQLTTPPYDMRQVTYSGGEAARELAVADGRDEIYDPRTDTISMLPPGLELPPGPARPPLPDARRLPADPADAGPARLRAEILRLLRSGEAREDGRTNIDGHQAIRIAAPAMQMQLLVDAETYEPIEWSVPVTGIGTSPDHGVLTTRFETYERLPASEANLALLDLRAQHPEASLDHRIGIDPEVQRSVR